MKLQENCIRRGRPPRPLAVLALLACVVSTPVLAQSSVTLYGLIDLGLRTSNHHGAGGHNSFSTMKSGGSTPTRLGFRTVEDLGNGWKAISTLETRFQATSGVPDSPVNYFQQSFMGLQHGRYGTLVFGRNYNVIFDLQATTFSAFKTQGPYLNSFKPEAGMLLGARSDQQLKYTLNMGGLTVAAQYAFGHTAFSPTSGQSLGGTAKYSWGGLAAGVGYLQRKDDDARKAKAYLAGVGYHAGPLYLNASFLRNTFDDGLNSGLMLVGLGLDNTIVGAHPGQGGTRVAHRNLWTVGGAYQFSPALSLGVQYSRINQSFHSGAPRAKADFFAVQGMYALSKLTELYSAVEYTRVKDMQLTNHLVTPPSPNGATNRRTLMVGMRHRF